ncbi:MAG: hypothetical protein J3K34DRAFT_425984 [Monoraphidium minutum]|nr:MAG: hypothetical protein J3K34DRAFT_425984 [Monoraphidium minutum]
MSPPRRAERKQQPSAPPSTLCGVARLPARARARARLSPAANTHAPSSCRPFAFPTSIGEPQTIYGPAPTNLEARPSLLYSLFRSEPDTPVARGADPRGARGQSPPAPHTQFSTHARIQHQTPYRGAARRAPAPPVAQLLKPGFSPLALTPVRLCSPCRPPPIPWAPRGPAGAPPAI